MIERKRGYTEAMKINNLADNVNITEVSSQNTNTDIENACLDVLVSEKKIDALIFATNYLSIEGLYWIQNNKIKIPDDLAFIGYDGGHSFNLFSPPITYIEQPVEEIAKEAVNRLMDYFIKGESSSKTVHVILNSALIIRDSC